VRRTHRLVVLVAGRQPREHRHPRLEHRDAIVQNIAALHHNVRLIGQGRVPKRIDVRL
jgi:hypothetical protein